MGEKKTRGFARMKELDPEKFKTISKKAGEKSAKSKKHRGWTRKQAQYWAREGGFARHGVKKIKLG